MMLMRMLQELEVFAVSVYDISPLSCLTNLQELDLHQVRQQQQQQQQQQHWSSGWGECQTPVTDSTLAGARVAWSERCFPQSQPSHTF
jgi:hypothetical protein